MRSKLVFESNTGDSLHQWGKYSVGTDFHYEWAKHKLYDEYKYFWNKHDILTTGKLTTYWDKYAVENNTAYAVFAKETVEPNKEYLWKYYTYNPAGTATYSWDKHLAKYVWNYYNIKETPVYESQYAVSSSTTQKSTNMVPNGFKYPSLDASINITNTFNSSDFVKWGSFDLSKTYLRTMSGTTTDLTTLSPDSIFSRIYVTGATGVTINATTGQPTFTGVYSTTTLSTFPANHSLKPNQTYLKSNGTEAEFTGNFSDASIGDKFFYIDVFIYAWDNSMTDSTISNFPTFALQFGYNSYYNYCNQTGLTPSNERIVRYPNTLKAYASQTPNGSTGMVFYFEKTGTTTVDIYVSNCGYSPISMTQTQVDTTISKGSLIGTISSTTSDTYPTDGISGSYWYTYSGVEAGDYVERVYSTNSNYKTTNAVNSDGYYYTNKLYTEATEATMGDYVGEVQHFYSGQYPSNGIQGDYWYVYDGTVNVRTYFQEAVWRSSWELSSSYLYLYETQPAVNRDSGGPMPFETAKTLNVTDANFQQIVDEGKYLYFTTSGGSYYYYIITPQSYRIGTKYYNIIEVNTSYSTTTSTTGYGDYLGFVSDYGTNNFVLNTGLTIPSKGTYIEQVFSEDASAYPTDGVQDGYWYTYSTEVGSETKSKGNFIEVISSLDLNDYPTNGIQNDYWYEYTNYEVTQKAGDFISNVNSTIENEYPENGIQDGYWYIYKTSSSEQYPAELIEQIQSEEASTYPENAINGDYWYIYQGIVPVDLYEITDANLIEGITYIHEINNEEDYVIGVASSAEIKCGILCDEAEAQKYLGLTCRYYNKQGKETEWKQIGKFVVDEIKGKTAKTAILVGYDVVSQFDIIIDEWIEETAFPITLGEMFASLCEYCGATPATTTFLNSDFEVQDNFQAIGITGRQILAYIAGVAGGYACANPQGLIEIRQYKTNNIVLNKTKYASPLTKAIYTTEPISRLVVQATADDVGVSSGTGDNVYKITNNPLLYADTPSEIQTVVDNIYNTISTVAYTPCEINLLQDFGINCGDIIMVDNFTAYIMSKEISPSGVKFKCVGNKKRAVTGEEVNSDIIALRGKTNELIRDLEKTQSTLTDTTAQLQSQITQTAEDLTASFTAKDEELQADLQSQITASATQIRSEITQTNADMQTLRSEITQEVDSISSTVESWEGSMSQIEQTAQSITSTVQGQDAKISQIQQTVNGISLSTNTSNGTASITIGSTTVDVPTEDGVQEMVDDAVADITITGYVRFEDLEKSGSTDINGDNITTGEIAAEFINLGGLMEIHRTDYSQIVGGYIGYGSGDDGDNASTPGCMMTDSSESNYFIATPSGVRMTYNDDNAVYCIEDYVALQAGSFGVRLDVEYGNLYPTDSGDQLLGTSSKKWQGVYASNGTIQTSDLKAKNSIDYDMAGYEAFYKALKPAHYKFNDGTSNRYHVGFISQDVEEALLNNNLTSLDFAGFIKTPMVNENGETYDYDYCLRYDEFVGLNTYMIQKLLARVEELETKVEELKGENA